MRDRWTILWMLTVGFFSAGPLASSETDTPARQTVLIVVGAEGTPEFGKAHREWVARWHDAAKRGGATIQVIGLDAVGSVTDRELVQRELMAWRPSAPPEPNAGTQNTDRNAGPAWLVLLGHGTFDGKLAKFNLRGPDLSTADLSEWLKDVDRLLAIINCASSSAPFLTELSGPNRILVTATRSGHESNLTRFGDHFSAAIGDPRADLDKDEQTSLLEAFLLASSRVREFYSGEGRLATEHSLIDDNGDRLGTPSDWFQGLRATKPAQAGKELDGARAQRWHLVRSPREQELSATARARRDQLESDLNTWRAKKGTLAEDDYLRGIEPILIELSRLYESSDAKPGAAQRD